MGERHLGNPKEAFAPSLTEGYIPIYRLNIDGGRNNSGRVVVKAGMCNLKLAFDTAHQSGA